MFTHIVFFKLKDRNQVNEARDILLSYGRKDTRT